VTLAAKGLLIEEARTNLLLRSQEFNDAAYTNSNVTVTANATAAPDGTTTADMLAAASTVSVNLQQSSAVAATSATYSIFVKKGSGATQANAFRIRNTTTATTLVEVTINYDTGVLTYVTGSTGATSVNFGNGWWRVSLSATTGITSGDTIRCDQCFVGASTISHSAYVWGAQLEAGAFATSYIPTVASQVTRSADVATMTGTNFSSWYNATAGTFVADFDVIWSGNAPASMGVIGLDASASKRFAYIPSGSQNVSTFDGSVALGTANNIGSAVNKVASAYDTSRYIALNGGAVATGTFAAGYSSGTSLDIGKYGASNPINGHIRSIAYYNTRLSDAQIQQLSAPPLVTTLSLDFINGVYNA
jgi:hypothetical protein